MPEPNLPEEKKQDNSNQNKENEEILENSDNSESLKNEIALDDEILGDSPEKTAIKEVDDGRKKETVINEDEIRSELLEFSEIDEDEFTDQDLADIEEAIAENLTEDESISEIAESPNQENLDLENEVSPEPFEPEIDEDLEARMQEEIQRKKKELGIKTVSKDKFIEYLSSRRNKIVYHALWHLVFNVEDHQASKQALYDALKEVTSKNPVEPIEEHKFYFGLGFILRLQLYDEKVVQFKNGKLTIAVDAEHLKEIMSMVGDPISDRPILTKTEKKKMFTDFLNDDFLDI